MDKEELIKKMHASQFVENNRIVLETINLLRISYARLRDVKTALEKIEESRFLDCVNYLSEAGYIKLRECGSRLPAELADVDYRGLEAKLTGKGIELAGGKRTDSMVSAR